jgi:uncharacterized delta-60 repeat protein
MTGRLGRTLAVAFAAALLGTPAALAGPADPDPSFGTGGLVLLPGADKFDALLSAPLARTDGKAVVGGLLRNSADKVFLTRLTPTGAADTSFDSDGEVQTTLVGQPYRRAATAQFSDGKVVAAAGSPTSGKVSLERYLDTGKLDTGFGVGGKLSATLSGATYLKVVAAVALPDGKTLLSAWTNYGGSYRSFVVMRFTATALDATFGTAGVARVPFGTKNSTAWDITSLSNGKIIAAGSVGDGDATNLALARLNANGTLDTAFGTAGKVEKDVTGIAKHDYATGVVGDATGGFTVTGPANGLGMLAKFTSTGASDTAFATAGAQYGGFVPAGTSFDPVDLATDAAGRFVVAGESTLSGTTRWVVARAKTSGASPLDASFAAGGAVQLAACLNHAGFGPTGVTVTPAGRILVQGACNEDGRVAAVRLLGLDPFAVPAALAIADSSEAAGHERIPLANVDPAGVLNALETLQGAPLKSIPLKSIPLKSIPLKSIDLFLPLKSIPLKSIPLKSIPLKSILLSDIPLKSITWESLLGITGPLQSYTLDDALRINPTAVGDLDLDQIDLQATPLKSITLGTLLLGARPLNALPAPSGGWCAFLAGKPLNCGNGVDVATADLTALELAGDDLTDYFATPLPLTAAALGTGADASPLARLPIRTIELSRTTYGSQPASSVGSLLKCGSSCTGTIASQQAADPETFSLATLGQLIAALPQPGGAPVTLGSLLAGIVAPSEIPFERAPKRRLLDAAELRTADLQTYTTTFDVDCQQTAGLAAVPALPDDARPAPGATLAADGGTPVALNAPNPNYDLSGLCNGKPNGAVVHGTLRMPVEPGTTLGPEKGTVTIRSDFGTTAASAPTTVDDSRDTGPDPANAATIGTDKLITGHISSATDTDVYTFTPTQPGRVTLTLTQLPADYDLAVYGPGTGPDATLLPPLKSIPLKSIPLKSIPVPDAGRLNVDENKLAPDAAEDIPLKSIPLKSISVNRDKADEAASVVVRAADVGKVFTAEVIGYNGATNEDPYVLRRIDRAAPPAPDCAARTALTAGAPGVFPASVPSTTQTIILVNQQRMAARENVVAATQTRDRLDALAAATNGVVVPVEGDAQNETGSKYLAWDQSPCDPEKADDVGDAILAVIGHVRQMGGGLPSLRSIVIAGPDEDIPMFRELDFTVLSNEADYAAETVLRGKDNAISSAQRNGYMLSDDRYADLNPNARLVVPDAAIGRLVETSADIRAQVDAYVNDADKALDPQDAFVAGYDFLKDASTQQLDALRPVVPAGSATGRIDETWDAALAKAKINRATAGLTALNAHFNHFQALPAAAFNGNSPNLLKASEATPAASSLAFTVGCHSGLSLSVALDGATAAELEQLGDWPQKYAQRAALYAGNTGFGYGDTDAVAWSERLMRDYAVNLASKKMTVGQAMLYAKQAAAAELGVTDDYWNKASMEAVFYGLPMWTLGATGKVGASAVPDALPAPSTVTRISQQLPTITPGAVATTTPRGTYFTVPGQDPLTVQQRPLLPKMTIDVTPADGLVVHGFLPTGFTTTETALPNPVIASPRVDLSSHEPEPDVSAPLWPANNFGVASEATAAGLQQKLTVIAGEYRNGVQRVFDTIDGRVMRSNSRDFQPLTIRRVDGVLINGGFSVAIDVDDTDAVGGNVLYRTDAGPTWHRVNLAVTGAKRLGGGGTLPSGTQIVEAKIHLYDDAGNVSGSDNKVLGYSFAPLTGQPQFPKITFSPQQTGYYEDSPLVGIVADPQSSGVTFQYSIDGGPLTTFTAPFRVPEPDEGEHFIRVVGSDGTTAVARLAVDSLPPTMTAEVSPAPNAKGWNSGDVTVTFECADAVSGVAAADCPAPVVLTGEGSALSVTRSTVDRAGHPGSLTVSGIKIDRTKPGVTSAPTSSPNADGWYGAPVTFAFTCTDALSGVGFCSAPVTTGATEQGLAVTVSGKGRDNADNETLHTSAPVKIDLSDPEVAINSPFGGVLIGALTGTAKDNLSGVKSVVVTYTSQIGASPVTKTATLTPVAGRPLEYTWQADSPGTGLWSAVARATDFAGHVKNSDSQLISVS